MRIEIDTGSRLDQSGDTTFAFSDDIQRAILVRQTVRDRCLQALGGERLSKELRIFAACVYLLIRDYLEKVDELRIDREYTGHEGDIKKMLLNLIWKFSDSDFPSEKIRIEKIKERGLAHEVAWRTRRKERRPDEIIEAQAILSLLIP